MTKTEIIENYQGLLTNKQEEKANFKKQYILVSWSRLIVFLLGVAVVWWQWSNWNVIVVAILLTIIGFAFLVKWSVRLEIKLKRKESHIDVLTKEIASINYDLSAFYTGAEYSFAEHPYVYDLDIFGEKSLFQKLVRCGTGDGMKELARILSTPNYDEKDILARQEAVKDLTNEVEWRQELNALANLIGFSKEDEKRLRTWLDNKLTVVSSKLFDVLIVATPIYSFAGLALFLADLIGFNTLILLLLVPLSIAISKVKEINAQMSSNEKRFALLQSYAQLFEWIENKQFASSRLNTLQKELSVEEKTASEQVKALGKLFEAFESRNNIMVGVLLNAFFLWDIKYVRSIEKWQLKNVENLKKWMDIIGKFESLSSLANMAYNHPNYTYPEISKKGYDYTFSDLGHPLIPEENRVNNSYSISNLGSFSIVTGANMAGKSTFLRTIGANLVLAMAGAPVCANQYVFYPIQLFSSMRTSDSLSDQESYFFSELKRLKQIVDTLDGGKKLFIILDEILKGTNSKDKAEGSKKFMEKLMKMQALGIIATHDLSLCKLEEEYSEKIKNYAFEVGFDRDELSFDYKLHQGVCQNMNASFLLRKMGLVDA